MPKIYGANWPGGKDNPGRVEYRGVVQFNPFMEDIMPKDNANLRDHPSEELYVRSPGLENAMGQEVRVRVLKTFPELEEIRPEWESWPGNRDSEMTFLLHLCADKSRKRAPARAGGVSPRKGGCHIGGTD